MTVFFRILGIVCALAIIVAAGRGDVVAQGWGWGSGGYDRSYDPPPGYEQQRPGYGQQPVYGQPGYDAPPPQRPAYGSVNPRCRELEYQLTGGGSLNGAAQDQLPRIDADLRQADAQYHRAQSDADHSDCYEDMFLFGRSLRHTPRCVDLDRQAQAAKSRLQQLKAQRDAIFRGSNSPRARRDDIVAELARNRCGDQYVREYEGQRGRNNSIFSFFSNEDSDDSSRYTPSYGASTYRTLCVRECDGFYFPISDATSENQFRQDDAKCRSQCAAPAELFYHRSDQDVDQMVSLNGRPYSQTPNAFRNRKVYIRGCSCNQSEYSREEIAKSEEELRTSKRADASGNKPTADSGFARRISRAVQKAPAASPAPAATPSTPEAAPAPATELASPASPPAP